jgi:quinone-modifying oxidoreductase subunit QmoC
MTDAIHLQPDTEFIRRLMASGGGDLKKCYQCATCSVVCDLAPDDAPFPRRQMIRAQWGLRDQLMADPGVWLCHHCGKCTTRCPRGARPGDVLAALRRETIRRLSFPRFLGDLAARPKALPLLFLLPALIFAAVALMAPGAPAGGPLEFNDRFPIAVLEPVFYAVSAFALLAFIAGVRRQARLLGGGLARGLLPALGEIAVHQRFRKCEDTPFCLGHVLTLWGFAGLAIVGTAAGVGVMTGWFRPPLPLDSPLKILANLSALASLAGIVIILVRRAGDPAKRRASTYFDWFFSLTLASALVTGILSQGLRLMQTPAMFGVYYVHLVLVFSLLLYAPYSKFAHLAYRTVAVAASFNSARPT